MHSHQDAFVAPFSLICGKNFGSTASLDAIDPFFNSKYWGQAKIDCKINAVNGNVMIQDKKLLLPNSDQFINLAFYYNSLNESSPWTLAAVDRIKIIDKTTIIVTSPNGYEVNYLFDDQKGCYIAAEGKDSLPFIYAENGKYRWYDPKSRHTKIFDEKNQVVICIDDKGIETYYYYDYLNNLTKIETKNNLYEIKYIENKVEIYNASRLLHIYIFDNKKYLVESKTSDGYSIYYNYDNNNMLSAINQTDSSVIGFTYKDQKVSLIQVGTGSVNKYIINYDKQSTELIDPAKNISTLKFNEDLVPIEFSQEQNSVLYDWNEYKQIKKIAYPDKTEECFSYDHDLNNLLTREIKRNKTVINHVYSEYEPFLPTATIIIEVDNKKALITQYIYQRNQNSALLRYEISPEGRVREYSYNINNQLENKIEFLQDVFVNENPDEELSADKIEAWKLKLSYPISISNKYYTYNKQGLIECIHEINGKNISETTFQYDDLGHIIKKSIKCNENETINYSYSYNDNHQQIKKIIGDETKFSQITTTTFKDNNVITTYPNGRVETASFVPAGYVKKIVQQANNEVRETNKQYYIQNRLVMITHPDHLTTYELYNNKNDLEYTISASGLVTEFTYHADCRYVTKKEYAEPISIDNLFPALRFNHYLKAFSDDQIRKNLKSKLEKSKSKNDRQIYTFYDTNDHVTLEIDAENYAIQYRYNGLGQKIARIAYANKLTQEEITSLLAGKELERVPAISDRMEQYFYDQDGLQIGFQDAAGYVTKFLRDAGGRIKEKIQYLHPESNDDNKAAHTYYYYDEKNQCIAEINAENYVTKYTYELDGKKKSEIHYANAVKEIDLKSIIESSKDTVIQYEYDELRRLKTERHSSGVIKNYTYDSMNKETSFNTKDQANLNSVSGDNFRGRAAQYNLWEEKTQIANSFISQKLAEVSGDESKEKAIWEQYAEEITYNVAGLKTKYRDVYGNTSVYYYNNDQQLVLSIDAMGAVTQYTVDSFGSIVEERLYKKLITTKFASTLLGGESKIHADGLSTSDLSILQGGYINSNIESLLIKSDQDRITKYERNSLGQIIKKIDPEGREFNYTYNAFDECTDEYIPNNTAVPLNIHHEYDARGNKIKTSKEHHGKVITTSQKHEHFTGGMTEEISENGNSTHFTLDKLGQVKIIEKKWDNELIKIEEIERDFLTRPIKKINVANQETIIQYDQHKRETSITYPTTNEKIIQTENIFGETIKSLKTDINEKETLQQAFFEHASNGQVIIEKNGTGNTHETKLGLMGEKIAVIDENKIVTSYSCNPAYHITKEIIDAVEKGLQITTTYEPNAFGEPEKIVDANGIVATKEYNKNGQPTLSIQDVGKNNINHIRQTKYDKAGNPSDFIEGDIKNPTQYHISTTADGFNREVSNVVDPEGLAIWKSKLIDDAGHVVKEINELGFATYHYYDQWQRKCFTVTALDKEQCSAIAYEYDHQNLTSVRRFYFPMFSEVITDSTTYEDVINIFKPSCHDQVALYFYDDRSHERFTIQVLYVPETKEYLGYLTEKSYDAAGREVASIRYANFIQPIPTGLTTEKLAKLASTIQSDKDQVHRKWYDINSRVRAECDQDGFVTETRYDNTGKVTAEIKYANKIEIFNQPITLDALLSTLKTNPKEDRIKFYTYRADGKLAHTVYPNGLVELREHDKTGRITKICQFAKKLEVIDDYQKLINIISTWQPDSKIDRITQHQYDNNNEILTTTDALGNEDNFKRNALGQIETHTDRGKSKWTQKVDAAKRLVEKISPISTLAHSFRGDNGIQYDCYSAQVSEKKEYDNANNIINLTITDGKEIRTIKNKYDAKNRIIGTSITATIDNPNDEGYLAHTDLSQLPIITTTLSTCIIYNTLDKKIAEQGEKGIWSYYFYNSLGQLVLKISKEKAVVYFTYDAFGHVQTERHYAEPVQLPVNYKPAGIIDNEILNLINTSSDDRVINRSYHASGLNDEVQLSPVHYYSEGEYGKASPTTKKIHNAFGECIYEATLIRPNVWAEKWIQYDQAGHIIAEINENRYLTIYKRDVFGNVKTKIEYYTPISAPLEPNSSISQLEIETHDKDRLYYYEHDLLGQVKKETVMELADLNALVFPIAHRLIQSSNTIALNMYRPPNSRYFDYTPTQQIAAITHPDGSKEYKLYDERHLLVAEIGISRTNTYGDGKILTPVICYIPNAFNQTVVTAECVLYGKLTILPTLQDLALIKPDSETIKLFDQRGLLQLQQNAEGELTAFTYTATKKVARELSVIHIWHKGKLAANATAKTKKSFFSKLFGNKNIVTKAQNNWSYIYKNKKVGWQRKDDPTALNYAFDITNEEFFLVDHIDEKRLAYNSFDECINLSYLREGQLEESLSTQYSLFGEAIGEGNKDFPLQRKFNTNGTIFFTNASEGIATIHLHDLSGQETLTLQAAKDDLSKITIDDLATILTWDNKRLERTETIRDLAGNIIGKKMPFAFKEEKSTLTRRYKLDRWHNTLAEYNVKGEIAIEREFDYQNHLIKEILPQVEVVNEKGESSLIRPTTFHHWNLNGFRIGMTDANGHMDYFVLDEAGQPIKHVLADNTTKEKQIFNASGLIIGKIDSREKKWEYKYNKAKKLIESKFPSGKIIKRTYDGKDGISSEIDPDNNVTRYNQDVRGNVWERYLPLGQLTRTIYDHQRLPIEVINADLSQLTWKRDYFGHVEEYVNLSKQITYYDVDYKKQLVHQYMKTKPGRSTMEVEIKIIDGDELHPVINYGPYTKEAEIQDLRFNYDYGLLQESYDASTQKTINYTYDNEGYKYKKTIKRQGILLHEIETLRDAIGRTSEIYNTHLAPLPGYNYLHARIKYDVADNERCFIVDMDLCDYTMNNRLPKQHTESWYTYDVADRVNICGGEFVNGKIQISSDIGSIFTYKQDLRVQESSIEKNTTDVVTTDIQYNDDEFIWKTSSNKGMITERTYQTNGWHLTNYSDSYNPSNRYKKDTRNLPTTNKNGWRIKEEYFQNITDITDKKHTSSIHYTKDFTLNALGVTIHQKFWFKDNEHKHERDENYEYEYIKADDWIETKVYGNYKTDDNKGKIPPAYAYYDSNLTISGKYNSNDEINLPIYEGKELPKNDILNVHFNTDHEGFILNKTYHVKNLYFHAPFLDEHNYTFAFLYDVNKEVYGGYSFVVSMSEMNANYKNKNIHPKISPFIPRHLLYPAIKIQTKNDYSSPLNWKDGFNNWHDIQPYISNIGDTLSSIAQKLFGDEHGALAIAKMNGLPTIDQPLKAGYRLIIPPYIGMHNKAHYHRPYHQFTSLMIGSLMPHYVIKPKDKNWLGILIKMIAIGIVLYFAPYLAGNALYFLGFTQTALLTAGATATASASITIVDSIAVGVVAALGDAAAQGLAIGLGAQEKFSYTEVLETAVSAGVGQALAAQNLFVQLVGIAGSAAATQFVELELGMRKKFDAAAIGQQVLGKLTAVGIGMGIDKLGIVDSTKIINNVTNSFVQELLNSTVHHGSFHIENAMLNSIGAVAVNLVSNYIQQSYFPVPQPRQDVENMNFDLDPTLPILKNNSKDLKNTLSDNNVSEIKKTNKVNNKPQQNIKKTAYNSNSMWKPKQSETRKNTNQMVGFYTEDGMAFGGEAYLAGRTGQKTSATMTASDQYYHAQGKVMSKAVEIASHELDAMGLLEIKSLYYAAKGAILTAGGKLAKNLGLFARSEIERIGISASSPSEIAWGYGELSSRQAKLLTQLPEIESITQLHKSGVNVTDLASLTARTGDEFAMFTLGSRRMIIRGGPNGIEIGASLLEKIQSQGWKWSAHTHPGVKDLVLNASGIPGDREVLKFLDQEQSLILNSAGRRNLFDMKDDIRITFKNEYSYNNRMTR